MPVAAGCDLPEPKVGISPWVGRRQVRARSGEAGYL